MSAAKNQDKVDIVNNSEIVDIENDFTEIGDVSHSSSDHEDSIIIEDDTSDVDMGEVLPSDVLPSTLCVGSKFAILADVADVDISSEVLSTIDNDTDISTE